MACLISTSANRSTSHAGVRSSPNAPKVAPLVHWAALVLQPASPGIRGSLFHDSHAWKIKGCFHILLFCPFLSLCFSKFSPTRSFPLTEIYSLFLHSPFIYLCCSSTTSHLSLSHSLALSLSFSGDGDDSRPGMRGGHQMVIDVQTGKMAYPNINRWTLCEIALDVSCVCMCVCLSYLSVSETRVHRLSLAADLSSDSKQFVSATWRRPAGQSGFELARYI